MDKLNPLNHPVCFVKPKRLTPISSWYKHMPFAMFLIDILKPHLIVELGTQYGDSYCTFCQTVKELNLETHCFAIDTWKGDLHTGAYGGEVLKDLRTHHDILYGDFSTLIQSTFDDALHFFKDKTIDLLHIDGYHKYEAVKHDFETWLPKMSDRGIILFHDINLRKTDFGVWRLWEELKKGYPCFSFEYDEGLGVLAVGKGYPEELQELFTVNREKAQVIQDFFSEFSNRLKLEADMNEKEKRIGKLEGCVNTIDKSIAWKLLTKFQETIDRILPIGTWRRNYFDLNIIAFNVIIDEGWSIFFRKFMNRYFSKRTHYYSYEPLSKEKLGEMKKRIMGFNYAPKISIITPVYNSEKKWLALSIDSVLAQIYENWELCLVDDDSKGDETKKFIEGYANRDDRIKLKFLESHRGISGASNEALSLATGEFILLLDHDDMIPPHALFEIIALLNRDNGFDLIYYDENKIDSKGKYHDPFYKPDWSPDLLFSIMYIGHATYRRQLVLDIGGFRSEYDFSQDYDLALRITEKTNRIGHIPKVLYHWRSLSSSAAGGSKLFARKSNIAALQSTIERRGYNAQAIGYPSTNRLKFNLPYFPLVSIIIPTDSQETILQTIRSILEKTDYSNFEIIVVTNSNLKKHIETIFTRENRVFIKVFDKPFNWSAKCNLGAHIARGEFLLFLNDDIEILEKNWIEPMVEIFGRKEVGAVTCKLIYKNNKIQHAGFVTGIRGLVGSAFHKFHADSSHYFNLIQMTRNVSAISGACFMIPKSIFNEVGGFDEVNTPIRHSDFDISFRVREKGYLLVYTPFAKLRHYGYYSWRKTEKEFQKNDNSDLYLLKRWGKNICYDPYFTENMRNELYDKSSYIYKLFAYGKYVKKDRNILLISHDLSLSGAPILLNNIAQYLSKNEYFVTILSPTEGELLKQINESNIAILIDGSILENPTNETKEFISQFDLVIANTILTWKSISIAKGYGIPVVWLIHESEFGRELAESNHEISKAFELADFVVFPSSEILNMYAKLSKKNNYIKIYYGLDVPQIKEVREMKPGNHINVIHVGSIEKRKGQDVLVNCIQNLPQEYLEIFHFFFLGRILDEDFYSKLRKLSEPLKNVKFIGEISYEELFNFYRKADIFVCSSRDEVLPLTILEAMSQKIAIISSRVGGIPEIIEDKKEGILVDKEDHVELLRSLILLYQDEQYRKRLGINAYIKYNESFTLEIYGQKILNVVLPLIEKGDSP